MAAPAAEKFYPVKLGETFQTEFPNHLYHSLQYKFKPQSAGRKLPGTIHLAEDTVSLQVPNTSEGQPDVSFEGSWAPTQPDIDCVAIFDGSSWVLEKLHGAAVNIGHTSPAGKGEILLIPSGADVTHTVEAAEDQAPTPSALQEEDASAFSGTPSMSYPLSITPSLSRHASQESPSIEWTEHEAERKTLDRQESTPDQQTREVAATQGRSPSVRLPQSTSDLSSSSSSSDEDSDTDMNPQSTQVRERPLTVAAKDEDTDMQDFEREFFENDSEHDSPGNESDSSDNQSDEEAKHF